MTHRGSSHLLPTPQTGWGDAGRGSVPAGAAAFLPSPAPSFLVFTPVPLQLTDYPKRNEAVVFREPGQHRNKYKTASDSA